MTVIMKKVGKKERSEEGRKGRRKEDRKEGFSQECNK